MKLSVIVPGYNVEKYLRECLDSLAAQTLRDYELILVNDGSTDGSQALIDEYTARFPRLITAMTVTNGGQGRAPICVGLTRFISDTLSESILIPDPVHLSPEPVHGCDGPSLPEHPLPGDGPA